MKKGTGRKWTDEQKQAARTRSWISANGEIINALMENPELVKKLKRDDEMRKARERQKAWEKDPEVQFKRAFKWLRKVVAGKTPEGKEKAADLLKILRAEEALAGRR